MIKKIHGHSFDTDLLTLGGYVLDIGCNDFVFSQYMINAGLKVIALDPIKEISIPNDLASNPNFVYLKSACVGIKDSETKVYYEYQSWGANSICNTPDKLHNPNNGGHANNPYKISYEVNLTTINEIMKNYSINQFEFIKIDCEGSEYEILENWSNSYAKQFSVEFHDFLGLTPIDDVELYHKQLNETFLSDYKLVYEDKEPLRGINNGVFQRNDTLYILKTLL
jgi:FkbM family methyltransferase